MTTFNSTVGVNHSARLLRRIASEACKPIKHQVFDAWYAAMRFTRTGSASDLLRLMDINPTRESGHEAIFAIAQCQALFKKREDLELGVDRAGAALSSFLQSEDLCRVMNEKLRNVLDPQYGARAALIHQMQRKISTILGPCPSPEWLRCGFGPGTNMGCSKTTNVPSKLEVSATTTVDAILLLKEVLGTANVAWPGLNRLTFCEWAKFSTVPKSWKTDRGIMVEPIVNTFLQKGIGAAIRARLRLFGVNLSDQSRNRTLALIGSRDGSLATIDLSMASDTISSFLVADLLPYPWFDLLYRARSHRVILPDGSVRQLEKFSSMGNGYTFELESLIFYALLLVVCPGGTVSAYGDDLIVPVDRYTEVINALELLGFVPNKDKSFGTGLFRESCGGDFFGGTNVRPIFFTAALRYSDLFRLHNWIRDTGRLSGLSKYVLRLIPPHLRHFGPPGYGDGYLHSDDCKLTFLKGTQVAVYKFKHFTATVERQKPHVGGFFAFMYYWTFKEGFRDMAFSDVAWNLRSRAPAYKLRSLVAIAPFGAVTRG